jgi:transcriptional regulator with XRE-family HTH domain
MVDTNQAANDTSGDAKAENTGYGADWPIWWGRWSQSIREERHLSISEVARKCALTTEQIEAYEHGRCTKTEAVRLARELARALALPVVQLLRPTMSVKALATAGSAAMADAESGELEGHYPSLWGRWAQSIREEQGLTVEAVALKCGIEPTSLTAYEEGRDVEEAVDIVEELGAALSVSPRQLISPMFSVKTLCVASIIEALPEEAKPEALGILRLTEALGRKAS